MGIIKKLDLPFKFRGGKFEIRHSEREMVTFNDKLRCLFSLVPNACAYENLTEYIGKLKEKTARIFKGYGRSRKRKRSEESSTEKRF